MDNNSNAKKIYKTVMLIIIVAIVTSIITSSYVMKKVTIQRQYTGSNINSKLLAKLAMIKAVINKKYIETDIDEESLIDTTVKGYVAGLGDEYTEYFSKSEMEEFKTETEGNYVGVGIYVTADTENNELIVLLPIKNSPAEKAGIETGDIIRKVDDNLYTGEDLEAVVAAIKGKEGTKVKVEIERDGKTLNFEIERKNVELYPIETEILENNIGYIEFSTFTEKCAKEFKKKYEELAKKNIKGLIIDLRDNGGGILEEAIDIADYALEKGDTVLITKNREQKMETKKSNKKPIINVPIVILTNKYTASASEVLTAALKENNKAIIVGEKTFGKGVIQELITLADKSGIKITVEEYFTPKENKINKVGISPDIQVSLSNNKKSKYNLKREDDEQLKKAIEVIKNGEK